MLRVAGSGGRCDTSASRGTVAVGRDSDRDGPGRNPFPGLIINFLSLIFDVEFGHLVIWSSGFWSLDQCASMTR